MSSRDPAAHPLRLGFSPCPNDCFVFYGLVHGLVGNESLEASLADVEELNRLALAGELDLAKVSYHAFAHMTDEWVMLPAGGALGRGVGPLVVTRERLTSLRGRTVAIPGGLTTANLLLRLSQPEGIDYRELRYDLIMPAVERGEVDAGLIIHESRFTYAEHGLRQHMDLGEWWEATTGCLLPLGGIAARRSLGADRLSGLAEAVRASVEYAFAHPEEAGPYIARHAQEMDPEVRRRHIELYVNEFSIDLGAEGRRAAAELYARAAERGLAPPVPADAIFDPLDVETGVPLP